MPIKCYVGQMRSGKTYEVVSNVILPGLADGRRVLSNITGLNFEYIRNLLIEKGVPAEKIGILLPVTNEQIEDPFFWRTDKDNAEGVETVVQPGDLLALDEVWRFAKRRGDLPPRMQNFVRMHGHMPHPETGYICEIALISQSIRDINENIRDVVQETYKMTKLTALGRDKSYRVDIHSGGSTSKANYLRNELHSYDDKYFPCYNSHSQNTSGVQAVEKNIDSRGNILRGGLFRIALPVFFILGCISLYYLWQFTHPEKPKNVAAKAEAGKDGKEKGRADRPDESEEWRITGWFSTDSGQIVMASDMERSRYLINPPNIKRTSLTVEVLLPDGKALTNWTGQRADKKEGGILK